MKQQQCHCRITLDEIAGALGTSLELVASRLGTEKIGADWRGRPSVAVDVAAELYRAEQEARERHALAQQAHAAYLEDRAARRGEIVGEAFTEARRAWLVRHPSEMRETLLAGVPGGRVIQGPTREADEAGRAAAADAGARFDVREPSRTFAEWLNTKEGRRFA